MEPKPPSKLMSGLQLLQLGVTLWLAVMGYLLNRDAEVSKQAIQRIEAELKVRQEDRAAQEAAERLRLQLFSHVSSAIEKKDARQQEAAKALVLALLRVDDTLRVGLIEALTAQAEPALKPAFEKLAVQERAFRDQQETLRATVARTVAAAAPASSNSALSRYFVDVFYCQADDALLKSRAEAVVARLSSATARARLRPLADSLNASPGYRVTGWQIRYNADEEPAAAELKTVLVAAVGEFSLQLVSSPTPNYMSVFVCT